MGGRPSRKTGTVVIRKEPVVSVYLRQLSYRRIFCLVMAATQMFPLPELPGETSDSYPLPLLRVVPESLNGENHAA